MNESEMGINGLMNRLMLKLKECDPQVWNRLKGQELEPQFYSFRYSIKVISFIKVMKLSQSMIANDNFSWLTLLLSQEFNLPGINNLFKIISCTQLVAF